MEYISADVLFWRSPLCMRKNAGEKEEEGDKEREGGREEMTSLPSLPLTPLTSTKNHLTSTNHLFVDHVVDRRWLQDCKEWRYIPQCVGFGMFSSCLYCAPQVSRQIRKSVERHNLIQKNWILSPVPLLSLRSFQVGTSMQESSGSCFFPGWESHGFVLSASE